MKRTFGLIIFILSCVAFAKAGDVSVKAITSTSPEGEATTAFAPDAENIYLLFKTTGGKKGDKIRAALIAESVGDAAPPNTKVFETAVDMDGDTEDGELFFSKPTNGWPIGKYRVDVYVNDQIATTAKFTVAPAKK